MNSLIRIAIRNVLRNRRRSLLTLVAVFLALSVMVGIRGFLNGLQVDDPRGRDLRPDRRAAGAPQGLPAIDAGGDARPRRADGPGVPRQDSASVPGVKGVAPRIPFGGMINANDKTAFAVFLALDPVRERLVCPRRDELVSAGKPTNPSEPTGGTFTAELLHKIGAKVGDKGAALLTNDRDGVLNAADIGLGLALGEKGLPLPEKKIGWIPLPLAQELLRMPGRATEIAIGVDDINQVEAIAARLRPCWGPSTRCRPGTTWPASSTRSSATRTRRW